MNSIPFWWVVKHRDGGYWATANGSWLTPGQAEAFAFVRRPRLGILRKRQGNRAVRVHARIPEPKLPAWVKRAEHGEREIVVIRLWPSGLYAEYLFRVSPDDGFLVQSGMWTHDQKKGARSYGAFTEATWDVWAEAAQRAAKMLRARKAAR